MKLILLFLLFSTFQVFGSSEANCYLVSGIYLNSPNTISDLKFYTVADIFTINNANTLSMNLDGVDIKFIRTELVVDKQTKLNFQNKKSNSNIKTALVTLDRTPKMISKNKEFYGNMIITDKTNLKDASAIMNKKNLIYNFYCRF